MNLYLLHALYPLLPTPKASSLPHLVSLVLRSEGVAVRQPGGREAALQLRGLGEVAAGGLGVAGGQVVAANGVPGDCGRSGKG